MMNYTELLTTLQRVECIINDRPIAVRTLDDEVVVPVTRILAALEGKWKFSENLLKFVHSTTFDRPENLLAKGFNFLHA